jgi:hypothetical protein
VGMGGGWIPFARRRIMTIKPSLFKPDYAIIYVLDVDRLTSCTARPTEKARPMNASRS